MSNPLIYIDPNGMDVKLDGAEEDRANAQTEFNKYSNMQMIVEPLSGKVSFFLPGYVIDGVQPTESESNLINASVDANVEINLILKNGGLADSKRDNISNIEFLVGMYDGSKIEGNKVKSNQFFSLQDAKYYEIVGGGSVGMSLYHELLEATIGAYNYPGQGYDQSFKKSHAKTITLLPDNANITSKFIPELRSWILNGPRGKLNIHRNRK